MAPLLPVSTRDTNTSLAGTRSTKQRRHNDSPHMATTTLKVDGMTCGACTSSVEAAFKDLEGVGSVSVSLVMERAVVMHDPSKISPDSVREAIEDRGFDAEVLSTDAPLEEESVSLHTTTIKVGGMTCGACTSAIEKAFKDIPGVTSFNISLLSERAVVEHDPELLQPSQAVDMIEDCGFDAELIDSVPSAKSSRSEAAGSVSGLKTTTVSIEGMTCGACTSAVEGGFKEVAGVLRFNISLLAERAVIVHDANQLSSDQIVDIIEGRGFDAQILSSVEDGVESASGSTSAQMKVFGLPDEASAADLCRIIRSKDGVLNCAINYSTTRATIAYQPSKIGLRSLVTLIEDTGYNALLCDSDDNNAQLESLAKTKEIQEWHRAFKLSLAFTIPVFLVSMVFPMFVPFLDFGSVSLIPGLYLGDVFSLILTIPVQFGIGRRFYISAWKSVSHGSPTMDVLVVLGTSAAFFFSVAAMIVSIMMPPHSKPATTFDTSTMLITFISLGRFLENRAKGQTSRALSNLMNLAPSSALIYADPIAAAKTAEDQQKSAGSEKTDVKDNSDFDTIEEKSVPTELLEVGDVVILKPGDKIPADGTVLSGESYVNESMVTGEAMPVCKKRGMRLLAGTVNGAGRLDFTVTRAGRDTQLSQIVRLVQEAQTSRAPIQRIADLVAGYFVPIILTLGLVTFTGWMILSHVLRNPPQIFTDDESGGRVMVCAKLCIAVIVFACPCALGLATPTAVMVGTGVGAEQGILIKGGATLETATKITHVVLDKTGTLTTGVMSVDSVNIVGEWNSDLAKERAWWTLIGLAESSSEHPIAKAVVNGAKAHLRIDPSAQINGRVVSFETEVGRGITTLIEAKLSPTRSTFEVVAGNATYLQSRGIEVPSEILTGVSSPGKKTRAAGTTIIYTAIAGQYAGSISLADRLKQSAAAAVSALHRMNISTSIVTGDALPAALHVAKLLNIPADQVYASVLPSGKQAIVESLQAQGHKVAMVGDGINDSPALATADIGISLASGTDVAVEAADIVLMKPNQLLDIPSSLLLSRTIFRRIKTNLLWACFYNFLGLPIAMGFLLPWGITLPPMAAGAAMACSSVTVVCSSLLLRWWQRPKWVRKLALEEGGETGEQAKAILDDVPSAAAAKNHTWGAALGRLVRGRMRSSSGDRGKYVPLRDMEAV
ncbi:hypothetical protein ANO11243_010820 [Dothideomycetidae sp. 11243]|nr:hypothetical protein ANO11243_010820 [fungal sp. No.11243]